MKRLWAALILLGMATFVMADDTEIYGTVSISVKPNVLIVFDTSGSMTTEDVPGEPYNPAKTYSGGFQTNSIYFVRYGHWYRLSRSGYNVEVDDPHFQCQSAKDALKTQGWVKADLDWSRSENRYICGSGRTTHYRLGNYLNFQHYDSTNRRRTDVAKEVVRDLIRKTDNVRFGLMRLDSNSHGGDLIAACGTNKSTLLTAVSNLPANGGTPLAETLSEAGLYFAGKRGWFNNTSYTTPMENRCQKNYIIMMTDGEPTNDNANTMLQYYINNDYIKATSYGNPQLPRLNDVAKYLYEKDCNPSLGTGTSFEHQNIRTYTIGFKTNQQLLQDTADAGGGQYFTAENADSLKEAFEIIMSNIAEQDATFVAPVVPVSKMNRTFSGDKIYLGFFKPSNTGRWYGNLKKYGLGASGDLLDSENLKATTDAGIIKDNARSYWAVYAEDDGPDVAKGGVGDVLRSRDESGNTRNLYTYNGTNLSLKATGNAFSTSNTWVTGSPNNLSTSVIDMVHGSANSWMMGDVIHFDPVVVHYTESLSVIYVGANDGMLHAFRDDTGEELWAFIPPPQLSRLSLMNNADHDYFIDGQAAYAEIGNSKILFFGERRGGNHYYAIDITDPLNPQWKYSIDHAAISNVTLGQSWCKGRLSDIKTSSSVQETVFFLGGGYDNNQDAETPAATDTVGQAVFAVNANTGQLANGFLFTKNTAGLGMTHGIVDLVGIDHDVDGITTRVYAGDLGGQFFGFRDDNANGVADGTWEAKKLFRAPVEGGHAKKIFYAPDVVTEKIGDVAAEYLFFGTGDRADPGETDVENRFYSIRNDWTFTDLEEGDEDSALSSAERSTTDANLNKSLLDVTDDQIQMAAERSRREEYLTALTKRDSCRGWYIRLENPGEKVVASPVVFGGGVYFTTYTPSGVSSESASSSDPCAVDTARGVGRLYAVDYKTGEAIVDYDDAYTTIYSQDENGNYLDADGNIVASKDAAATTKGLHKKDRRKILGTAIPSAPVIAILKNKPVLFVGVEGGVVLENTAATREAEAYYWRINPGN